jgi:inositol-hexakisphosphate kinase
VTQDKYQGREIKKDEFPAALASFLCDGERLLAHQIPGILGKIYALARIINRLKGFRFYGCSLLFIYDGDHEVQEALGASYSDHPTSRSRRGESLERHRRSYQANEKAVLRPFVYLLFDVHTAMTCLAGQLTIGARASAVVAK